MQTNRRNIEIFFYNILIQLLIKPYYICTEQNTQI